MNILLIGSGAREYAIAKTLKRSTYPNKIFCCANNNNPGLLNLAHDLSLGTSPTAVHNYAQGKDITFAIIGPEAPLAQGLADALQAIDIPCIGPTQMLAQIETSKGFARDLMTEYAIPGQPKYQFFSSVTTKTIDFLSMLGNEFVIKADGLCGGKGVKLSGEHLTSPEQAITYCCSLNSPFVIEEKLYGPEFSLISFSDGTDIQSAPPVQDYKRAYAGDTGPNTGGMGSYTCANHRLPFLNQGDIEQAQAINQATIYALYKKYRKPFVGFLYGGFMKTRQGIKLIEYNARLGDPEAINILSLLETDFIDICQAMLNGTLNDLPLKFTRQASVVKYVVPKGYPKDIPANLAIDFSTANQDFLYFAGLNKTKTDCMMTGSRALAVLGLGDNLQQAEQKAQQELKLIHGDIYYRPDIGTPDLYKKQHSFCYE